MTMMSNLPSDLVEEILSRLPLKSMRSLRLTCKNWNALLKSRSFTKLHTDKEEAARKEGESQKIVMMDNDVYLMSIVVNDMNVDSSIELKGKLTCLDEQVTISQVFHCEGLLLCILRNDSRLVVLNPYLGQTKWIETYPFNKRESYKYAFGYVSVKNNSCRSLKILRFTDGSWYQIYDFDSGLWRDLDVTPHWGEISAYNLGVSLNGNTYWGVIQRESCQTIYFDFTRERFGSLLYTQRFTFRYLVFQSLSCVKEEKLAALFWCNLSDVTEYEVWITTKIDADEKVSWSKFLTVDNRTDIPITILDGGFFIDEEKKVAVVFGSFYPHTCIILGEAGYFREVKLGEPANDRRLKHVCSMFQV
ncbi:unnamed protein product [Microthlaspi erraticum]|uniref:F-box domain-containing protein n=1 Tax=Microthlaspi erraticum TaxID=1685480 RepID=A0A6D2J1K9_9BRAS|nr:unnamed protein product [Microthlaspi erraticum]